ncbi:MAG TPA: asparagine synthase (glutamine-hydrolyzing), partial [Solirubrobacterales bacterium]|nr:asparagine synthase (glutamine-hydrolyzing) [Solirubrobacterales bacterium]
MCDAISHRGPDSSGSHVDDGVALGFRRLAIIDLESGEQPIGNEDGAVLATCNGEIYNFRELRAELIANGHTFRTGSDAEVIPHLYEEHGEGFVNFLRGMFAIALWDRRRRRLILVRDRMGVKPLYWAELNGSIVYGSEPAAILASGLIAPRPDARSVLDCLTAQYVHPPRSGFVGINKLPPASLLEFDHGGDLSISRYWSLRHQRGGFRGTTEEALERTDSLLREATKMRLISDVPLGAFLSGGVDSSLVVAYMAELQSTVRTFSVDFAESDYSEGAHAERVARLYGTQHETFTVEPDVVPLVADAIKHLGEPFADSSAIPTYLLSELTRRSVTVSLSGDGGDEAFGGYQRYAVAATADRFGAAARLAGRVSRALMPDEVETRYPRVKRGLDAISLGADDRYAAMMAHFDPGALALLCTPEFLDSAGGADAAWREFLIAPPFKGMQRYMALDI